MKNFKFKSLLLTFILAAILILVSCKSENSVAPVETPSSNPITKDTITGYVKGTLLSSKGKYYIKDSIYIKAGDTLLMQAGVELQVLSTTGYIDVQGYFISEGTQSKQNKITTIPSKQSDYGKWRGILGDSMSLISLKWTTIEYSGSPDPTGHTNRSLQIKANAANTSLLIMEDCILRNTADDGIQMYGGNISILRNTFKNVGQPGGDPLNFKQGTQGEIAYNLVWNSGGNCVKINSKSSSRQTDISVHNNTFVAAGYRLSGELTYGVLIDVSGRAEIFNNIFVDTRLGIGIVKQADTANVKYGNNLFFATVDTLNKSTIFYPTDCVGKIQSTDVVDISKTKGIDPMFVKYNPNFNQSSDGNNDYHLKSGSPALGKGLVTLPSTLGGKTYFGEIDLGAYTSSTNSHK